MEHQQKPAPIISEDGLSVTLTLSVDRILYEYARAECKKRGDEFCSVEDELAYLMNYLHGYVRQRWCPPQEIIDLYHAKCKRIAALRSQRPVVEELDDGIPF